MHGLRYILLVFLVVGKTKFKKNDYTRDGQGTFYNEKLGPKLTKNQKHCQFTLLTLARKLKLMTFFSKWENRFIYQVKEKINLFLWKWVANKNLQPGDGKKFFFKFLKEYCHVLTQFNLKNNCVFTTGGCLILIHISITVL